MYGKSERFEDYDGPGSQPMVMATSLAAGTTRVVPAMRRRCILLVEAGVVSVKVDAATWLCAPGTALALPSVAKGQLLAKSTSRVLLAFCAPSRRAGNDVQRVLVSDLVRALMQALAEEPRSAVPSTRARRLGRLLLDEMRIVDSSPIQLPWPQTPRLIRLCESFQSDFSRRVTLSEAATLAGMARRTLTRRFLQETGMTLAQWDRAARLTTALTEVAKGESIYSAAAASGFGTASSLCATFKRATGSTLQAYFKHRRSLAGVDEQRFFAAR